MPLSYRTVAQSTVAAVALILGASDADAGLKFTAYNDVASHIPGQYDGTNVTTISLGENGQLVDLATGSIPGFTATITGGGGANVSGTTTLGTIPNAGTDANDVFAGIIDPIRYIQGNNGDGFVDLLFGNLDPDLFYEVVLLAERSATDVRLTEFTISGADSFINTSSNGADFDGPADPSVILNANNIVNGYVARFSHVDAGLDGEFTVRVDGANQPNNWYLNAFVFSTIPVPGTLPVLLLGVAAMATRAGSRRASA